MKVKINGKECFIDEQSVSVADLLKKENVENPQMVSVQLNNEFVDKGKFETTYLKDSDEIDFLYFMGGGSKVVSERKAKQ